MWPLKTHQRSSSFLPRSPYIHEVHIARVRGTHSFYVVTAPSRRKGRDHLPYGFLVVLPRLSGSANIMV